MVILVAEPEIQRQFARKLPVVLHLPRGIRLRNALIEMPCAPDAELQGAAGEVVRSVLAVEVIQAAVMR
jgi:hypothetical protein